MTAHVDRPELCAFCGETVGWCQLTGGKNPCEGLDEAQDLAAEIAAAPVLFVRFGATS